VAAVGRVDTVRPVTDRSGTGPIDLAILQSIDTATTRRPGRYLTCGSANNCEVDRYPGKLTIEWTTQL
jgi:hypothetical protein